MGRRSESSQLYCRSTYAVLFPLTISPSQQWEQNWDPVWWKCFLSWNLNGAERVCAVYVFRVCGFSAPQKYLFENFSPSFCLPKVKCSRQHGNIGWVQVPWISHMEGTLTWLMKNTSNFFFVLLILSFFVQGGKGKQHSWVWVTKAQCPALEALTHLKQPTCGQWTWASFAKCFESSNRVRQPIGAAGNEIMLLWGCCALCYGSAWAALWGHCLCSKESHWMPCLVLYKMRRWGGI